MEAPGNDAPAATRAVAEKILTKALGGRVRLDAGEALGGVDRRHVHRFRLLSGPAEAPSSVVVKTARISDTETYDPEATDFTAPAWRLFHEWVGLRFLAEVSGDDPIAPRLHGGDRETGTIVLEDLGTGVDTPDKLLLGHDPIAAEGVLVELAATLGKMHARSAVHKPKHDAIRGELGRLTRTDYDYAQLRDYYHAWVAALGHKAPAGADAELDTLIASLREPGPFLVYTHGDPCPDNWLRTDSGLRLIDFEAGLFRHALLDGVYGRIHFPTCWCVNRLPEHIPMRMEEAYRAELVEGCPEAGDDTLFYHAVVGACASHVMSFPGDLLADLLREDITWGISTARQRVLVRFDILARLAEEFGHLEALGETFRELATGLRALWPAEADEMPLYPAFRGV